MNALLRYHEVRVNLCPPQYILNKAMGFHKVCYDHYANTPLYLVGVTPTRRLCELLKYEKY
jgi:hypothetical protein